MKFKNKTRKIEPFELCLFIIFALQLLISIYFNVALLCNHMTYDSSWSYLKAELMWKEKALFSDIWSDQTNVFLDSSMLLASLLYGITGKLFLSYGISNCIVLLGSIWCMAGIIKDLGMRRDIQLICVNLLLCPYLINGFDISNDLGYFNCFISGPAFYGVRVLLFLMTVRVIINLQKGNRKYYLAIFTFPLYILTGLSSGMFMTIILLLPCIVYFIENVFIDNKLSELMRPEAVYVYLCLFFSFLGKMIGERLLNISAIDVSRTWISIEKIWKNIGAVIQGMMSLLGTLPVFDIGIPILSKEGVCRLFSIVVFAVVVISFIFGISSCLKNFQKADRNLLFLCSIAVCNFIMFSLFNVAYGSPIFEDRYLICTYMVLILLIGFFLTNLDKKKIFSLCLEGALIIGILGINVVSDYKYVETTNEFMKMDEVKRIVETTDAKLIYCWGNALNLFERNMRVYDLSRVYKSISDDGGYMHWGDYLYYENAGEYTGPVIMITAASDSTIPESVLEQYTLIGNTDLLNIYYCQSNIR